jgi:hypothetical protein
MYAVVKTGGKQYRVSAGEKLKIEQIVADVGQEILLEEVLLIADGEALNCRRRARQTPALASRKFTNARTASVPPAPSCGKDAGKTPAARGPGSALKQALLA